MPKHRGLPGRGFLRLGGLENSKNSASGSLRRRDLRLGFTPTHRRRGVEQKQKWPFSSKLFQPKLNQLGTTTKLN